MKPYFQDEAVTIYHADAIELMPQLSATVIVTDPPYNARKDIGGASKPTLINGDLNAEDYSAFCREWFTAAQTVTNRIVFSGGITHMWEYPPARWVLAWNKPGAANYSKLGGFNIWEPILVYGPTPKPITQDAATFPPLNRMRGSWTKHPCPKNPRLWAWLVEQVTTDDDVILDPFLGSGTTARIAKDLGRRCIGIEIEERYCAMAAERMSQTVLPLETVNGA